MAPWKALKYAALAVGIFLVVSAVVSVVAAILSIVWAIVTTAVTVAVLAALLYAGVKLYGWLGSDDGSASNEPDTAAESRFGLNIGPEPTDGDTSVDRVDRLKQRYAEGDISEAELERRLELELDAGVDGRDRELDRSRR